VSPAADLAARLGGIMAAASRLDVALA